MSNANLGELPSLPRFDSLPASEGLTNLEAFRLSLQHALILLRTPGFKPPGATDDGDARRAVPSVISANNASAFSYSCDADWGGELAQIYCGLVSAVSPSAVAPPGISPIACWNFRSSPHPALVASFLR